MCVKTHYSIGVAGLTLLLTSAWTAQILGAPPVRQTLGMPDVAASELVEADCRICHDSGVPDRHHVLYGEPLPADSVVPFEDGDRDRKRDTVYGCLNCHDANFTVVRDCNACHTEGAHHSGPAAQSADCVSCHGDIVDNMYDGHYIPTYATSPRTPAYKEGTGLPLNSRGKGAGACDYCHDNDGLAVPVILTNKELHHATRLNCLWCHPIQMTPQRIRVCEGCHGPESLHNIQTDSPNPANLGTVVYGEEDAGYGHVGRDAGPGDSDCWGCHGFSAATAPSFGPMTPTIHNADRKVIRAGTDAMVILSGAAFRDVTGGVAFESDVAVTAGDGSSVILTPEVVTDDSVLVTIPGDTAPGNYALRAVKADAKSNPTVVSVVPKVAITAATHNGKVTIRGSGFGGYAKGSGTSVTKARTWGWGRWTRTTAEQAKIISWSDTRIVADFGALPKDVTVNSVFGQATSRVTTSRPDRSTQANPANLVFGGATTKAEPVIQGRGQRRTWWWW